jgi:dephospho-CoA kinase
MTRREINAILSNEAKAIMQRDKGKRIWAVVGMAGSGKSEVIEYLQKKFRWPKIYFGAATFERIKKEKLKLNYKNEQIIRERIRKELGMGAYAILAMPKINELLRRNKVILLESLYSWDEYKIIKSKYRESFKTIAVYASPEIRLKRMLKRSQWRPMKSKEEFSSRDWTEIEGTDKGGPIAIADYTIINEGSLEEMHKQIDKIFLKK